MKKIKPYLFWIITSVILLAEIIWVVVDKPSSRLINDDSKTPADTKKDVDRQASNLKKLVVRADRTVSVEGARLPERPIAPEIEAELSGLISDYIPHNSWVADIDELSQALTRQGEEIKADLESRSEFLHESLNVDSGSVWFDEYKLVTRELVRKALESGLYGDGNIPDDIQLEESQEYRGPLDLFSGQNSPPGNRQALLAINFRFAELLVDTILGAKTILLPNPLYIDQVVVEGEPAKTFDAAAPGPKAADFSLTSLTFGQPVAKSAQGLVMRPFTLVVTGEPASVLGVGAALDGIHLEGGPIVVRLSSTAKRVQVNSRGNEPLYDSNRMHVEYETVGVLVDHHKAAK